MYCGCYEWRGGAAAVCGVEERLRRVAWRRGFVGVGVGGAGVRAAQAVEAHAQAAQEGAQAVLW